LQREDLDTQRVGVSLSKDLMAIAGEVLKTNITTLGLLVFPVSEQLLFFVTLIAQKIFKKKIKPYIPDFKLAFEHFCIHAGLIIFLFLTQKIIFNIYIFNYFPDASLLNIDLDGKPLYLLYLIL
jgi:hypothetical protein